MLEEIKRLIYQNIYQNYRISWVEEDDDQAGNPEVTRHLVRAYLALRESLAEDNDESGTVVCLEGDEAYQFMLAIYSKEIKRLYRHNDLHYSDDQIAEGFEWPEEIPSSQEMPRGMLRCVAKRLALHDLKRLIDLRTYFLAKKNGEEVQDE